MPSWGCGATKMFPTLGYLMQNPDTLTVSEHTKSQLIGHNLITFKEGLSKHNTALLGYMYMVIVSWVHENCRSDSDSNVKFNRGTLEKQNDSNALIQD